ncbi:hypothetical protein ANN_03702 [Periplaneta americana]|uniref:C2 domain-containing protein n=1 Tax=Periplaneta americana TaxID=6978 RepID=A0ABQ8TZQ7_PERAM|nr:hypothetical protein ANN_03702 [Periplaneta americana]
MIKLALCTTLVTQESGVVSPTDDASISEEIPPVVLPTHSKSASPSPIVGAGGRKGPGSVSSGEWPPSPDEDIDRMVAIHLQRSSLSSLGQRSDSLASVYSGARYGTVAVKGEVEFGLEYNYKAGALEIHVKQCRDLAPIDTKRNRSDPYVKVYLLPDKSKSGKRKTKVKKHTLNPVFDETLKFQMTLHGLETRTLWLTVWHSDMFGRNDFLGEVMMGLENKVFDDPSPHWYPLQERTEPFDDLLSYKGDLIIGLKFVPPDVTSAVQKKGKRSSRGSLNVLVKEAKNLTAVKANGTSDPFCKSYLLPDKGRSSKQKTPVLKRTCNPVWNYTFMYEDVSLQELSERSLELTVWDHDRLGSNEFLGGLRFNLGTGKHYGKAVDWMDATGKEVTLWQQMLERPNFWVEGCLTLRPSLEHRNSS